MRQFTGICLIDLTWRSFFICMAWRAFYLSDLGASYVPDLRASFDRENNLFQFSSSHLWLKTVFNFNLQFQLCEWQKVGITRE